MRLGHKGWALVTLLLGGLVVASYMFGVQQGRERAPAGVAPAPARGGLPPAHPPLPAAAPAGPAAAGTGGARFTHFRVGNRNVKGIYVDGDTVWIGSSGGVIRYDVASDTHQVFDNQQDGLLSNGIFHVSKLGARIVAGTYGGGLSLLDPATGQWSNYNIQHGLADQFVYDVLRASNGDVWIATWSGANRVRGGEFDDPAKWDTYTVENTGGGLPNVWVYGIAEGPDGALWFATEGGLARYRDGAWQAWRHGDGLGADYEAVRDAISFTNDPGKASEHHARQKVEQGLQDVTVAYNPNYIISLAVDRNGVVWCGTWGGGLARFDGQNWRNYTTADGLPANHIFMLYLDQDDRLWIGTSHGLARRNESADGFSVLTTADGLFANNVFSMASAPDGTLWVGSFGGVARIMPAEGDR